MGTLYADDKGAQIGITIAFTFLVLIDLIGNSLVIAVIATNKSMRTPMNFLLINLAVSDMVVAIFNTPRFIFSPFFVHPDGLAGTMICKLLTGGVLMWLGAASSVMSLFSVCFERYFAVVHPFFHKLKLTVKKVKIIVASCWLFAAFSLIPHFLVLYYDKKYIFCMESWSMFPAWAAKAYSIYWLIVYGIFPITTMFILYSRVIYALWFKQGAEGTQLAVLKSRKRITKMVITVSIIYGLTWLPELTTYMLIHHMPGYNMHDVTYMCTVLLVMCNSTINPFVYALQNEKFRRHMWEIVCCRRFRGVDVNTTSTNTNTLPSISIDKSGAIIEQQCKGHANNTRSA